MLIAELEIHIDEDAAYSSFFMEYHYHMLFQDDTAEDVIREQFMDEFKSKCQDEIVNDFRRLNKYNKDLENLLDNLLKSLPCEITIRPINFNEMTVIITGGGHQE